MEQKTFEFLSAVNAEGLDNSKVGYCENINNTESYFGTKENVKLEGKFLYIYQEKDDFFPFIDKTGIKPTITLHVEETEVKFYKL